MRLRRPRAKQCAMPSARFSNPAMRRASTRRWRCSTIPPRRHGRGARCWQVSGISCREPWGVVSLAASAEVAEGPAEVLAVADAAGADPEPLQEPAGAARRVEQEEFPTPEAALPKLAAGGPMLAAAGRADRAGQAGALADEAKAA